MNLVKINVEAYPKAVLDWCDSNAATTSTKFCAYLEHIDGDVVERCFATRIKRGIIRVTEVSRTSVEVHHMIIKNLLFNPYAGYNAVYKACDVYSSCGGWRYKVFDKEDYEKWHGSDDRCGFSYVTINSNMILDIPEYKYCGYTGGTPVISYLRAYKKDKNIEFFGKLGLPLSPILMNKAKKDGKFRRFLFDNHKGIAYYGVKASMYAYAHGITIGEAKEICDENYRIQSFCRARIPEIKGTDLDRHKVMDYINKNNINYTSYNDYLHAIKTLNYDLSDTKNTFPNDFERMHDLRATEYASQKAKEDRKKREKIYADFRRVSASLKRFETKGDKYSLIIPKDISELILEGEMLSHCVGRMGYDKKMVDGVSLIMFCRKNDSLTTPFVTVEYRLDSNKLNQCYGAHDIPPNDDVKAFVEAWAINVATKRKKEALNDKSNNQIQGRYH